MRRAGPRKVRKYSDEYVGEGLHLPTSTRRPDANGKFGGRLPQLGIGSDNPRRHDFIEKP